MPDELGLVATGGAGFRARAEARQREYRAKVLRVGWSRYGHLLDSDAATKGANFVLPEAHGAAVERAALGKGIDPVRTFGNMLSSQAMCFNVFAPLAHDPALAVAVLRPSFPMLAAVRSIAFEYTPAKEVFGDQTGKGGVDCDLLIEGRSSGGAGVVIAIETKFVEPEFSVCGFRKTDRKAKGRPMCPEDVGVRDDESACLYTSSKRYHYWQRSREQRTLAVAAVDATGCPFGGPEWQLWVNHTLVHAEARRRGAQHAQFAVCAPKRNEKLLAGEVLGRFRNRLAQPTTFTFVALDDLLGQISSAVDGAPPALGTWSAALQARYGGI